MRIRTIRCSLGVVALAGLLILLSAVAADAETFTLTVRTGLAGSSGRISIEPIGGLCRVAVCTFQVGAGTNVRLAAGGEVPGLFSAGTGPAAACGLSTCRFTMNGAVDVTATFSTGNGPLATIVTTLTGDGRGTVDLDGYRCQNVNLAQTSVCSVSYLRGSEISLDSSATVGSRFTRFLNGSGGAEACGIAASCRFILTGNATATATFSALQQLGVTPPSVTRSAGQSQVFIARGAYSDGMAEPVTPGVGQWLAKSPLPAARLSLAAAAADGKVYALGGLEFNASFSLTPVSSVMVYDPASDTWEARAPMTTARASLGAATVAGRLYAIGGSSDLAGNSVATVERYDPATDTWTPRAPLSTPRAGIGVGVIGGIIYAVGGATTSGGVATAVGTVEAYDSVADQWTLRAPMPTPRSSAVVGVVGGILYAAGGSGAGGALATVEAYDPVTNTWTPRASMPTGLVGAAGAVSGDALYLIAATPGGVPRGLTFHYDPARDAWSAKSDMLAARGFLGVAALDGVVYGIGGAVFPGASPFYFNNVEAFTDRVLWSSSAPSVATVNDLGLATAAHAGTSTIVAAVGTVTSGTNSATFTVTPLPSDLVMDAPVNGSTVTTPFTVRGWAINRSASSGTGVDAVHVYAAPSGGGSPIFLGAALYGIPRADVGAIFGSQFTNSGFGLIVSPATLPAGSYELRAYGHNSVSGAFEAPKTAAITVLAPASHPLANVDAPTAGTVVTSAFEVGGWAIDQSAASGTGIDALEFYVQPAGTPAPGVFVGSGSYGIARTDLGSIYGAQFTNSGFHFTISGLGTGSYTLAVRAHSTVSGSYSIVKTVPFTVNGSQVMSIDTPAPEATVTGLNFAVSGWSIDREEPSGIGVDALHIYAYPNPGSGQTPIFLGVATAGIARSDVGAIYGTRFTNSGYTLNVNGAAAGLSPGVYNIAVHSHSTNGSFNNLAVARITIQ